MTTATTTTKMIRIICGEKKSEAYKNDNVYRVGPIRHEIKQNDHASEFKFAVENYVIQYNDINKLDLEIKFITFF